MGHLTQREGDTYYHRGWWYADEKEYEETAREYREQELRDQYYDMIEDDEEDLDDDSE